MLQPLLNKIGLDKHIEFVAQLPVQQAAKRLSRRNESAKFFSRPNPLRVTVTRIDAETYQFKMARDAGRNVNVEVVGTLQRRDDYTTLVTANGQISRPLLVLIPASAILVSCAVVFFPNPVVWYFGFSALGLALIIAVALVERNRLIDLLWQIMLGKS